MLNYFLCWWFLNSVAVCVGGLVGWWVVFVVLCSLLCLCVCVCLFMLNIFVYKFYFFFVIVEYCVCSCQSVFCVCARVMFVVWSTSLLVVCVWSFDMFRRWYYVVCMGCLLYWVLVYCWCVCNCVV